MPKFRQRLRVYDDHFKVSYLWSSKIEKYFFGEIVSIEAPRLPLFDGGMKVKFADGREFSFNAALEGAHYLSEKIMSLSPKGLVPLELVNKQVQLLYAEHSFARLKEMFRLKNFIVLLGVLSFVPLISSSSQSTPILAISFYGFFEFLLYRDIKKNFHNPTHPYQRNLKLEARLFKIFAVAYVLLSLGITMPL